jgi:hypothetical protein
VVEESGEGQLSLHEAAGRIVNSSG